jgi:hypothetical protein
MSPNGFSFGPLHHLLVMGRGVQPVADGELALGLLGRVDHLLAFGHRDGHRLFADHVLAGLEGADGVLGVHGVGQHHVHDVNVLVIDQPVVGFVVVHVLVGNVVLAFPLGGLGGRTRHQAGELAELGLLQGGGQLVFAVAAQTHQRHAQGFAALHEAEAGGPGRTGQPRQGRHAQRRHPHFIQERPPRTRAGKECIVVHKGSG